MDVVVKHLATRGLEVAHNVLQPNKLQARSDEHPQDGEGKQMSVLGGTIIVCTIVAFAFLLFIVNYSVGVVMNNLTMIETPVEGISIEAPTQDADNTPKKGDTLIVDEVPSIRHLQPKPITNSVRTTMRHLKATAGRWARFRGLKFAIIYGIAHNLVMSILAFALAVPYGASAHHFKVQITLLAFIFQVIAGVIATMITVPLHMAWTHSTIAMPSAKGIRSRLPTKKQWKLLWTPAAVFAVTQRLQALFMEGSKLLIGELAPNASGKQAGIYGVKVVGVLFFALAIALFITLPAEVTLTRMEASMLPDEEDTVVPFDRSFGGKVVPAIVGGTGAVGFWDAWKSFNWEARRRLIKLNVKLWAINMALVFVGVFAIMSSLVAFGGNTTIKF